MRRIKSAQSAHQDWQAFRNHDTDLQHNVGGEDYFDGHSVQVVFVKQDGKKDNSIDPFPSIDSACKYVQEIKDELLQEGVVSIEYRDKDTGEWLITPRGCFDYESWYQEESYLGSEDQEDDEILWQLRNASFSETDSGFKTVFSQISRLDEYGDVDLGEEVGTNYDDNSKRLAIIQKRIKEVEEQIDRLMNQRDNLTRIERALNEENDFLANQ